MCQACDSKQDELSPCSPGAFKHVKKFKNMQKDNYNSDDLCYLCRSRSDMRAPTPNS